MRIIRCMYCGIEVVELNPDKNIMLFNLCGMCEKNLIPDGFEIQVVGEFKKGEYNVVKQNNFDSC